MGKKITVSVISDLTTDQRVIRISNTLQQMGFEVFVIARKFKNSLSLDEYLFTATRIHCYFRKGIMQYAEFNFKLFLKLLFCKTDYFLANDLDVLIPNFVVSRLRNKKLFYDTHEYFTGVPELRNSPTKKRVWKFFEDWIFPNLTTVYTVNDSVKNKYHQEYGNQIGVIRNVPSAIKNIAPPLIPMQWKNKQILLLQGAGINEGRGGLELLEAMNYLSTNYLLLFIGSGTQWHEIAQNRISWNLQGKVEMIDKLHPAKLQQYTAIAHIGFSLDSFADLNCLYNLPNKIFDYIQAGVPIIATGIPEVKQIMDRYKCGICIADNAPATIANAIKEMTEDKQMHLQFKVNCEQAAMELTWENESVKLKAIYQPYL
ncbi:MAG: glycosyltransferase [Ferruginibacter sp.]